MPRQSRSEKLTRRRYSDAFKTEAHFALNLLRFNRIENISQGLYDNTLSLDRVLAYEGL